MKDSRHLDLVNMMGIKINLDKNLPHTRCVGNLKHINQNEIPLRALVQVNTRSGQRNLQMALSTVSAPVTEVEVSPLVSTHQAQVSTKFHRKLLIYQGSRCPTSKTSLDISDIVTYYIHICSIII